MVACTGLQLNTSGIGASPQIGRETLKWSVVLARITALVSRMDIVFSMSALWFTLTGLERNLMVKRETGLPFRFRVNSLLTDVAKLAITLKNANIVHSVSHSFDNTRAST